MMPLLNLLNRLSVMVQPKRIMREEFGEVIDQALTAGWITQDFFNFGISDAGTKHRDGLRAAGRAGAAKPVAPAAARTLAPEPKLEPETTPDLEPEPVSTPPVPIPEPELEIAPITAKEEAPVNSTPTTEAPKPLERDRVRAGILNFLQSGSQKTVGEIAEKLGKSTSSISSDLKKMAETGRIERTGEGLPGRPYMYSLPSDSLEPSIPALPDPVEPTETVDHSRWNAAPLIQNLQSKMPKLDPELEAMKSIVETLEPLGHDVRDRVMQWAGKRLGLV
jgi:DNA-binding Lrp family transcriptional regulator